MRETGPIFWRFSGPFKDRASDYIPLARTLLGRTKAYLQGATGSKSWTLPDGTVIRTLGFAQGYADIIEIIPSGGPTSLKGIDLALHGFTTEPHSSAFPSGLGTESHIYRAAVFKPDKPDATAEQTYKLFLHDESYKPAPATKFKSYSKRNGKPWHKQPIVSGNLTWWGPKKLVLSWIGIGTRYFDPGYDLQTVKWNSREPHGQLLYDNPPFGSPFYPETGDNYIFCNGDYVYQKTSPDATPQIFFPPVGYIKGAAIVKAAAPSAKRYLIFVAMSHQSARATHTQEKFYAAPVLKLEETRLTVGASTLLATQEWGDYPDTAMLNQTPWLFNRSGTQGVCNRNWTDASDGYGMAFCRSFVNITATDDGCTATVVKGDYALTQTYNLEVEGSYSMGTYDLLSWTVGEPCAPPPDGDCQFHHPGQIQGELMSSASSVGTETRTYELTFADYKGDDLVTGSLSFTKVSSGSTIFSANITTGDGGTLCVGKENEITHAYVYFCTLHYMQTEVSGATFTSNTYASKTLTLTVGATVLSITGSGSGGCTYTAGDALIGGSSGPTGWSGSGNPTNPGDSSDLRVAFADLRIGAAVAVEKTTSIASGQFQDTYRVVGKRGGSTFLDETHQSAPHGTLPGCGTVDYTLGDDSDLHYGSFSSSGTWHANVAPPVGDWNGCRRSASAIPEGDIMLEIPLWDADGGPMVVYLDGPQDPFTDILKMPGSKPRLWPIGVM